MIKQKKIYSPIIFLLSWLGFTIFTFSFGPYYYKLTNPFVFYTYLILIHLFLFLGYKRGLRSNGRGCQFNINYLSFVKTALLISIGYNIVKLIYTGGGNIINFGSTFNDATTSYMNNVSGQNVTVFSYIDMIFYPIYLIAITNAIFSYKYLLKPYKICLYVLVMLPILTSIGSATRSGIVQIAMITMAAFLLAVYKKNIIVNRRQKIIISTLVIISVIGFLSYSSLLVSSRGGSYFDNALTGDPPRDDFFVTRYASPEVQLVVDSISFYISHSYFRLNEAMNMPFEGLGFGFSNSVFLINNIEKLTGWSGLNEISYGVRLDRGDGVGNYGLYWSTFYTWIASDFTFPGTIIVVFFIGYFLSLALKDSLYFSNPFSVTVFCLLFYFIFHFAFNNPLQDGQGITTYLLLPIIWFISRKKYNKKPI